MSKEISTGDAMFLMPRKAAGSKTIKKATKKSKSKKKK